MSLKKQKVILTICLVLLFSMPFLVSAAGLVPCGGDNQTACKVSDVFVLIARVTNWLIAVAGLYAAYQIINAGFFLIISFGNEESITAQKSALTNAVIGFALSMMAFILINTVVNILLVPVGTTSKCNLNLRDPLTYLTITTKNVNDCSK